MKLRRSPAPHPLVLYLAPALGLAMVLIFFLLLSSTFLLQPGIAVSMPQSPFLLSPQRDPCIVSVTAPPLSAMRFRCTEAKRSDRRKSSGRWTGTSRTPS